MQPKRLIVHRLLGFSCIATRLFRFVEIISPRLEREIQEFVDSDLPPVSKCHSISDALLRDGVAYERELHVDELFVHPENRGGLGVNQHDCHTKIKLIAEIGADAAKLNGATAFEISAVAGTRMKQIGFNQTLIEQADGLLAPAMGR